MRNAAAHGGAVRPLHQRPVNAPSVPSDPEERMLNLRETCEVLNLSENTVRQEVRRGTLRCKHVGRKVLFRRCWLVEWMEREPSP